MRHIREEHCFGITCNLRRLQRFCKLPVMYLSFFLPFLTDIILLSLVEIVKDEAKEKSHQHDNHHNINILVYRFPFLLNRFNRHITDKIYRSVVYRPHINQRTLFLNIMIKHNIFSLTHAFRYLILKLLVKNPVGPVKILQI